MLDTDSIRQRRNAKKSTQLNMMLIGPIGIGKRTFLKNLTNSFDDKQSLESDHDDIDPSHIHLERSLKFIENSIQVNKSTSPITLNTTIVDLGLQIDNRTVADQISSHIEGHLDRVLENETKIERHKKLKDSKDSKYEVCIFFIDANNNGLTELDIRILKNIDCLTNILLVIGKADRYNSMELKKLKKAIMNNIHKNEISLFYFDDDNCLTDLLDQKADIQINNISPFAIICGDDNEVTKSNGTKFVRYYQWGKLYIEDLSSSDFVYLKSIILGSHLQDLKDTTNDIIYEKFRTRRLLEKNERKIYQTDFNEFTNQITPTSDDNKSLTLDNTFAIQDAKTDSESLFTRELEEKNKIIEAYQKKIGDLEKILKNSSQSSSPSTKVSLDQRI